MAKKPNAHKDDYKIKEESDIADNHRGNGVSISIKRCIIFNTF